MIRIIEALILSLLVVFALFIGVHYSQQIKSSSLWIFDDGEKVVQEKTELSEDVGVVQPVAIDETDLEEYLKQNGILQQVMINDWLVETIILEVERVAIETPNHQ